MRQNVVSRVRESRSPLQRPHTNPLTPDETSWNDGQFCCWRVVLLCLCCAAPVLPPDGAAVPHAASHTHDPDHPLHLRRPKWRARSRPCR